MVDPMIVQNCTFPGGICRKAALEWSHENKIAVCTNRGMYIMSSYCSPIETGFPLPLHKQVISLPSEMLDFKLFEDIALDSLGVNYPAYTYQIMMDHTLMPRKDQTHFQGYKCAKWSPKGASSDGSCLLATLTLDHGLVLHRENDKEWKQVCDLSEMLFDIRKSLWDDEGDDDKDDEEDSSSEKEVDDNSPKKAYDETSMTAKIEKLKDRAYNLAPMEMTWTNMFSIPQTSNEEASSWCYLIVSMKSGHIVWWKVSPDDMKMVTLAHEWDPKLGLITALNWQQTGPTSGILVVGSFLGQIGFSPVNVKINNFDPKIYVKPFIKIWSEIDRIAVDHIVVLKCSMKKFVAVATKQHFIVSCEISLSDSDAAVKNRDASVGLHGLPVTGISVVGGTLPQTHLLLSTMEGLVVKMKVNAFQTGIVLKHEALNFPDIDLEHNMIQGLGVSPNGALCAIVLNTSVYFDHLIKREPIQFVMFMTKPIEEILLELDHVLKPQFSFLPTATNSICKYTDYLECARIHLANSSHTPELFKSLIGWTTESYDRLSTIELQFIRFLLKCFISELAVNVPFDKNGLKMKLEAIDTVIMRNYVSKVVSDCHDRTDMLSAAQKQSLLLIADWLYMQYGLSIASLYEAVGCECPSSVENIMHRENCRICDLPVKLENIHYGECEQKHRFGRCCLSLILCDVIPYYQCLSCKSMAIEDVWCSKFICTYCSLPMTR